MDIVLNRSLIEDKLDLTIQPTMSFALGNYLDTLQSMKT